MNTYPLSLLDYAFLLTETPENPKHIGMMAVFRKPDDAADDYLENFVSMWLDNSRVSPPFSLKLHAPLLGKPRWHTDAQFSPENHCFYHRLPTDSDRTAYYDRVCELHENVLDRSRPIWDMHFFDGLKGNRFGVYFRMHHAYGDGQSIAQWVFTMLATKPGNEEVAPLWSNSFDFGNQDLDSPYVSRLLDKLISRAKGTLGSVYGLSRISSQLWIEALGLTKNAISIPFTAKPSKLTGQVPVGRDFSTVSVSLEKVNHIRKLTRSTLNHVAITCIDMAMNRYLDEIGAPLDGPFTICMPVSLRPEDAKKGGGNAVGMVPVKLASNTDDPLIRLRQIGEALQGVRNQVNDSPPSSITAYSLLTIGLPQVAEMINMSESLPPLGHAIVSNVPGPGIPMYLGGSQLEEPYPISSLTPGMFLNITIFSYNGDLFIGLLAAKDTLPNLNRLGAYIYDAFIELEEVATFPDKDVKEIKRIVAGEQACTDVDEMVVVAKLPGGQ